MEVLNKQLMYVLAEEQELLLAAKFLKEIAPFLTNEDITEKILDELEIDNPYNFNSISIFGEPLFSDTCRDLFPDESILNIKLQIKILFERVTTKISNDSSSLFTNPKEDSCNCWHPFNLFPKRMKEFISTNNVNGRLLQYYIDNYVEEYTKSDGGISFKGYFLEKDDIPEIIQLVKLHHSHCSKGQLDFKFFMISLERTKIEPDNSNDFILELLKYTKYVVISYSPICTQSDKNAEQTLSNIDIIKSTIFIPKPWLVLGTGWYNLVNSDDHKATIVSTHGSFYELERYYNVILNNYSNI